MKRPRGRPKREQGDEGLEQLVDAARTLLRNKPRTDVRRKELADLAGVSYSLVSYYFQDQVQLIETVARPVIDSYLAQLQHVVQGPGSVEERFRRLIILFVRISRDDGQLLDAFINFVKQRPGRSRSDFLSGAYMELNKFLQECEEAELIRETNRAVTQTAVWGLCKIVAQTPALSSMLFDSMNQDDLEQTQADMIMDLLFRGIGKSTAHADWTNDAAKGEQQAKTVGPS